MKQGWTYIVKNGASVSDIDEAAKKDPAKAVKDYKIYFFEKDREIHSSAKNFVASLEESEWEMPCELKGEELDKFLEEIRKTKNKYAR